MYKFRSLELAMTQYQEVKRLRLRGELRSQIERAALSVCLNLSEGSAKEKQKDRKRFYNIAYASNAEVKTILLILENEKLFRNSDVLSAHLYRLQNRTR